MNLEKRSQGGPMEPEEDLTPKGKKPVVVYIMILFIAAFLLMAWSFASHQRSNTEAIGELQSSVTAMRSVQDKMLTLQDELEEAQDEIEELEREASLRDSEREAYNRQYQALANLYTLERLYRQENLENCRKVIDRMEEEDLAVCLSDNLPLSERELGLNGTPRERHQQLKEAVETREEEAQETDGAASGQEGEANEPKKNAYDLDQGSPEGSGCRLGIGFMGGVVFPACGHLHTGPWNEGAGQHRHFPAGAGGTRQRLPHSMVLPGGPGVGRGPGSHRSPSVPPAALEYSAPAYAGADHHWPRHP